eukprot:scaffold27285_cov107-Isochrysis_galbana.AAC.5
MRAIHHVTCDGACREYKPRQRMANGVDVLVLGGCPWPVAVWVWGLVLEALAGGCDGTLFYPLAD